MFKFIFRRINRRYFFALLLLILLIPLFQIYPSISLATENHFLDSPYTRWMSIDPFNTMSAIFFILLPLIAALPAGSLLRKDIDSGFIYQSLIKSNVRQVLRSYLSISFGLGFIVVLIPLAVNFGLYFFLFPNIVPDNLLNSNLLIIHQNTLFVTLYYSHPFLHAALSILWSAFWGGLFSLFVTASSLWIKNTFIALMSGLVLQIILLIISSFLPTLKTGSLAPFEFTRETALTTNIKWLPILVILFALLCYSAYFIFRGVKKRVFW
ncbi:hypothetical protein ACSMFR_00635 [Listeria aquatica]|uniref:hypothetical protein n=1 Tax=Listeria aquatica TaxID=1494960 RepID=UPI003F71FD87